MHRKRKHRKKRAERERERENHFNEDSLKGFSKCFDYFKTSPNLLWTIKDNNYNRLKRLSITKCLLETCLAAVAEETIKF